jgi:splicing factor U2AF subunit
MADHLSLGRLFGTEEDKVNCPFYFKIGACRHGNRCSRTHVRPNFSQTLLIPNMYTPPAPLPDGRPIEDTEFFGDFVDEVLEELKKHGRVEEVNVCQNLGDHLFGNVYIKYSLEEEAEKALMALQGRFYNGKLLQVEYSPVTDFREARCRQYDEQNCNRGGYCNFMHLKETPEHLRGYLVDSRRKKGGRRFSRSPPRGGAGGYGGGRPRRNSRSRSPRRNSRRRDEPEQEYDEVAIRSNSRERRRLIAKWNRERERGQQQTQSQHQPVAVSGNSHGDTHAMYGPSY